MRFKANLLGKSVSRLLGSGGCRRVALVGSQASGKTVFLTSLIDHLCHHDPALCDLGRGAEILRCRRELQSKDFSVFPYEYHRSLLIQEASWPEKSKDISELRLDLELRPAAAQRRLTMGLELVDFPGERVADFLMAGRDYQAWSDLLLSHIQLDPAYGELAREFFAELAKASGDELRLLTAYKLFLGRALRRHYCRVVSPSHFLLDGYGHRPEAGGTPETWACERFCGRGPGEEFAPLSQEMRSRSPELTRRFAGHYREYRQKVVEPLLDWLADADQLLLFLDIPGILMGGPSMYNDELMVVQRVLELCERRGGSWRDIWQAGLVGWLLFRPSRIRRVGVVATKADLVATNRDVDHLENLAREMTYKRLRGLKLAGYEFFSCAAAASTKRSDNRRPSLTGRLVFDEAGRLLPRELSQPAEFAPSRVPERWPSDDEWEEFSFPEVYPQFSSRRDAPPRQEGLDRILRFILQ